MNIVAAVTALAVIACVLATVATTVFEVGPLAHHHPARRWRRHA